MKDIIVGIDSGTSVVKSVAFSLSGEQLAIASLPNKYTKSSDGRATQPLPRSWQDCVQTIRLLGDKITDLPQRLAAIAVTAQGDGTWLIDGQGSPIDEGWLWLDSRSAPIVREFSARDSDRNRYEITGTGLNSCQQGAQLAYMKRHYPELLAQADKALHCKDWIYYKLTGELVTDPSEGCFTFGDFRTRAYSQEVIEALGLADQQHLLPRILDGSHYTHGLSADAASETGLLAGTPVTLGYVDVVCTALGAGLYTGEEDTGCSVIGSTSMHMRCSDAQDVRLNQDKTGYCMVLPIPDKVAVMQSNMAATLNIDWAITLAQKILGQFGLELTNSEILQRADDWLSQTDAAGLLYHPYISEAGERGPFIDNAARASLIGLDTSHDFTHIFRAVIEGLAMAARHCYDATGTVPTEVRLTGGAAKSAGLREIFSAALNCPVRVCSRAEAGAAGAAMMASVAIGASPKIESSIQGWVVPYLTEPEPPNADLTDHYKAHYQNYVHSVQAVAPIWARQEAMRAVSSDKLGKDNG